MSVRCQVLEYSRAVVRNGVIQGVKIIGTDSRNGYRYPQEVLRRAKALYEATPVFAFHPSGPEKKRGSRQLCDHFGMLSNIRERGEADGPFGLFGDLHIKQRHPMATLIVESAGAHFGLSHNAVVEMNDDGSEVTEIIEVNSVDLVENPATTKTLFEEHSEMELAELKAVFEEKFDALLNKVDGLEKAQAQAAAKAPAEMKPKRIQALETITPVEEAGPAIGNSHDDLMAVLRGYSLT